MPTAPDLDLNAARTAMSRVGLSLPARLALADGLLAGRTVLDFGCGRGGDVRRLAEKGIDIRGWDPHYRPHPPPEPADVVLCSYVLNVIADPVERKATLARAFELARRLLVVAVRGSHEKQRLIGQAHGDGTVTQRGTFHHLFQPAELRNWLQSSLDVAVVPVQPGIAYLFRNTADRASYLAYRYGGGLAADDTGEVLTQLASFLSNHGRPPIADEQPQLCQRARAAYGSLGTAVTLARRETDPQQLERAARRRRGELLLVLALERFHGGPRLADLPSDRVADVRAFYGSTRHAMRDADRLLWATGQLDHIRASMRRSPVGKTSPTALYVHVDAEHHLPPLLRLYAACGAMVAGRPEQTTLLKLHHDRACVSFLLYPTFDTDPHPRLADSLTADLRRLSASWSEWSTHTNRPLLHRKEEFLHFSDARYARFQRLTRSEIRAGLYDEPGRIGREQGWEQVLAEHGRMLRGHRLMRAK